MITDKEKFDKMYKKQFYTLTIAMRAIFARATKANYEPLFNMDGSLLKKRCPTCFKNAFVFNKVDEAYIVCSSAHFTPFDTYPRCVGCNTEIYEDNPTPFKDGGYLCNTCGGGR